MLGDLLPTIINRWGIPTLQLQQFFMAQAPPHITILFLLWILKALIGLKNLVNFLKYHIQNIGQGFCARLLT